MIKNAQRSNGLVRDAKALAKQIHERYRAVEREGQHVAITPMLSRLFELVPEYEPYRRRQSRSARAPVKNPGLFTIQTLADRLGTTVGAVLGESRQGLAEYLTPTELRTLREAVSILGRLLDQPGESLTPDAETSRRDSGD